MKSLKVGVNINQSIIDDINSDYFGVYTDNEYLMARELDYLRRVHKSDLENIIRLCSESKRRRLITIEMRELLKDFLEELKSDSWITLDSLKNRAESSLQKVKDWIR